MSSRSLYCGFCAERKSGLIDLRTQTKTRRIVMRRLRLFSEMLVDLNDKSLGAHLCGGCYSMLESCAEWVSRVKRSQQLLGALCDSKSEVTLKVEVEECEGRGEDGGSWAAYSWSCGHCAAALPSMDALREHSKSAHTTCFGYKCADCDARPPPAFSDFVRHVRAHRHHLRNYCPYCDIKMEDDTHMELHLNEDRCETCGGMEHVLTPHITLHEYEPEDISKNADKPELLYLVVESDRQPELQDIIPQMICQPVLQTNHLQSTPPKFIKIARKPYLLPRTLQMSPSPEPDVTNISSWSEYPLSCRFCNETFRDRTVLVRHCMKVHKTCFGLRCVDCPETQESYLEFIEHVRRHRPELKRFCPYCYCDMRHDSSHIKQHEDDHLCVLCGKIYNNRKTLRVHQRDTRSPFIKPRQHYARLNLTDLNFDICGVTSMKPSKLLLHRETHKLAREKPFSCDECSKAFYSKCQLNQHKKIHDTAVETCKVCNKTFRRNCLKIHVRTHTARNEFQCDHCKRWFRSKTMIQLHLPTHFGVKPYKCSYCDKRFKLKNVLDVHIRQHTGERPYKCDSCDKTFVNWSNCDSHMKRMHGTTLAKYKNTTRGKMAINLDTLTPVSILQNTEVQERQKLLAKK